MAAALSHPTISDIARKVGVSKSTVSAALRDDHRVSARTREEIRQAARKMGYIRNAFAATLATSGKMKPVHSLDVAIVSHVPLDQGDGNYPWEITKKTLTELGYEGHHYDIVHDHISCGKLRATLYNRGYCGIIFANIYESRSELFSIDWSPFSLICMGRTYRHPPCDFIRSSPFETISIAWNEVRNAGYRRIGFVLPHHHPVMLDDSEREAALWSCQQTLRPGEQAIPPLPGD
jgi:LacI family transcriptional regulator